MKIFSNTYTKDVIIIIAVDNNKVLTGSENGDIRLWSITKYLDSYHFQCEKSFLGHSGKIHCLTLLPNNSFISSSADNTMRIWDIASGDCKRILGRSPSISHCNCETIASLSNNLIAVAGNSTPAWGCFDVWDIETGGCLFYGKSGVHRPHGISIAVAKGYLVFHAHCHSDLSAWKINHHECIEVSKYDDPRIYSMAISPIGEIITGNHNLNIFTLSDDGEIQKFKSIYNNNVIDTIIPLEAYKVLIINRQHFDSGTIKIWDCLKENRETIGNSRTLSGQISNHHIVLPKNDIVLSLSQGQFCIQQFSNFLSIPKDIAEIRKNARLLAQAYRTGTSFFSNLPRELNLKIAALTGNLQAESISKKIAVDHFCKPFALK